MKKNIFLVLIAGLINLPSGYSLEIDKEIRLETVGKKAAPSKTVTEKPQLQKRKNWRKIVLITAGVVITVAASAALYYYYLKPTTKKPEPTGVLPTTKIPVFASVLPYQTSITKPVHNLLFKKNGTILTDFRTPIEAGETPKEAALRILISSLENSQCSFKSFENSPYIDWETSEGKICRSFLLTPPYYCQYVISVFKTEAKPPVKTTIIPAPTINGKLPIDSNFKSLMEGKESFGLSLDPVYREHVLDYFVKNVLNTENPRVAARNILQKIGHSE